ncbi:predicted protein [Sclerotinia sclerotiorum 1980 UF-70]|uniref:Uncharacterized protein n=1 Tax=Sclerotinia sclerotiorum (strain ATCC 18683 / 1980 / Ss-1) TaxID=665079 RepID=A7F369_SCLS1|nr:predicted protein [Sclerotinia sclerotiorum 1980 UF-70]EDN97190.1 predicted protein [Sclerotinia sclerotiorum 1980 UF-70]
MAIHHHDCGVETLLALISGFLPQSKCPSDHQTSKHVDATRLFSETFDKNNHVKPRGVKSPKDSKNRAAS